MFKLYKSLIILIIVLGNGYSQEKINNLEGKKVLIVYGGWEGHKPKIFANKIANWLNEKKADVKLFEGTSIYSNSMIMNDLDLIIQHITMGKIKEEESKGLRKAVASGVGLAGCHGGLGDSFRNDFEYQYMIGGQFVNHPGNQVKYEVNISDKPDPITQGIYDFKLITEQYYMHIDPKIKVLATTKFNGDHDEWIDGVEMPVVWIKPYGKGRVFYCSLGHSKDIFEIPEVWTLITRGVSWAAQKD